MTDNVDPSIQVPASNILTFTHELQGPVPTVAIGGTLFSAPEISMVISAHEPLLQGADQGTAMVSVTNANSTVRPSSLPSPSPVHRAIQDGSYTLQVVVYDMSDGSLSLTIVPAKAGEVLVTVPAGAMTDVNVSRSPGQSSTLGI